MFDFAKMMEVTDTLKTTFDGLGDTERLPVFFTLLDYVAGLEGKTGDTFIKEYLEIVEGVNSDLGAFIL